jgi:hypothetical protein
MILIWRTHSLWTNKTEHIVNICIWGNLLSTWVKMLWDKTMSMGVSIFFQPACISLPMKHLEWHHEAEDCLIGNGKVWLQSCPSLVYNAVLWNPSYDLKWHGRWLQSFSRPILYLIKINMLKSYLPWQSCYGVESCGK